MIILQSAKNRSELKGYTRQCLGNVKVLHELCLNFHCFQSLEYSHPTIGQAQSCLASKI